MEHTPERKHATIIFTSFEVKFSKETILKVSILDHVFIKEKLFMLFVQHQLFVLTYYSYLLNSALNRNASISGLSCTSVFKICFQ